jgi:hypothetical protein
VLVHDIRSVRAPAEVLARYLRRRASFRASPGGVARLWPGSGIAGGRAGESGVVIHRKVRGDGCETG